jgi:hypothetical protein
MSESVQLPTRDLAREFHRLLDRLRSWSAASWDVRAAAGGTRAERAMALARELARLSRAAGSGAPDGAQPPPLAAHGLADQLTVLAEDLLDLLGRTDLDPARRAQLVAEAHQVVTAARADLDGVGFGFAGSRGR